MDTKGTRTICDFALLVTKQYVYEWKIEKKNKKQNKTKNNNNNNF